MEEDIKILEKFINEVNKMKDTPNEWYGYSNDEMHILKRAIENLTNRNKELEEKNQDYKCNYDNIVEIMKTDYIPKSKVEEKIEEYRRLGDEFYEKFLETNKTDIDIHDAGISCDAKAQVLQELLEE